VALDGNTVAKLIDCGLSKGIDSNDSRSLFSITGGALDTPGHVAPEVTDGKHGVASDIFSFGVVLLELLTSPRAAGLVDSIRDAIEDDGRKTFLGSFTDGGRL
jgi:serine/threonine protein kinase